MCDVKDCNGEVAYTIPAEVVVHPVTGDAFKNPEFKMCSGCKKEMETAQIEAMEAEAAFYESLDMWAI